MAEASIQVRPEIVEMPVPVTRENTVVVGGITGVFPEGTLEITENGNYDVVTKERVNVYIPQDPETFLNPDVSQDVARGNSDTVINFLANLIKETPVFRIGENVTRFEGVYGPRSVFAAIMDRKHLKVVGGSSALAWVNCGVGDNSLNHGPVSLDLSELTVSGTARFEVLCMGNHKIEEVRMPRQPVVSGSIDQAFYYADNLKVVDMGGVLNGQRTYYAFQGTSALEQLIIRNDSTVMGNMSTSAFTGSAIAAGTCQIYVPDSLVDAYKADSVWRTYAAQIHPLSELPEE
jgi:hypothetical protein